ncbi:DUF3253 domain-containing protein [Corynebacterium falsenii]|nr:DUF3253 domain-containing protein [Corynebacterium falsenii]
MTPRKEPERTDDGHYIIVNGRKWRATDPNIPPNLESELVAELMNARRAVKEQGDAARFRVQDAKVALGERGEKWWEPTDEGVAARIAAAIRTLLRKRDEGKTICPSDAARVAGSGTGAGGENGDGEGGWRNYMDLARSVAADMATTGEIIVMQSGEPIPDGMRLQDISGPIRLARGPKFRI